jgi:hypothetical protein
MQTSHWSGLKPSCKDRGPVTFVLESARAASLEEPKAGTLATYDVDSVVDTALWKALA